MTTNETLRAVLEFLTAGEACRVLKPAGKPERHFFQGDQGGVDADKCPACALRALLGAQIIVGGRVAAEAESDEDREQRALADIAREDAEHRAYLDETPDARENTHGR